MITFRIKHTIHSKTDQNSLIISLLLNYVFSSHNDFWRTCFISTVIWGRSFPGCIFIFLIILLKNIHGPGYFLFRLLCLNAHGTGYFLFRVFYLNTHGPGYFLFRLYYLQIFMDINISFSGNFIYKYSSTSQDIFFSGYFI